MTIKIFSGKIRIIEPDGKISPYEKFIITRNPDKSKTDLFNISIGIGF